MERAMRYTAPFTGASFLAVLVGFGFAGAFAVARGQYSEGFERARAELAGIKEEILAPGELRRLHHETHARVGERDWSDNVLPDLLGFLTRSTARDTGRIVPTAQDIVDWVKAHPDAVEQRLRAYAVDPSGGVTSP
jgi:hypothetical protein